MDMRLWIGGAAAVRVPRRARGQPEALARVRGTWREGLIFGTINGALPFTLIAWGEKHIDSGVAAIANASVPIFVAILAIKFNPSERSSGLRLAGIIVGLVGVGVLAGVHPDGGSWAVIGTLAVVLASFSYACGGLYGQRAVGQQPGPVLATSSMLYGGARPPAAGARSSSPDHAPDWKPVASLLALAVGGTAIAQLVLFRMLRLFGAAQALARHLPVARDRADLRRGDPRRAAAADHARRARPDPRRRRARLGRLAAAPPAGPRAAET